MREGSGRDHGPTAGRLTLAFAVFGGMAAWVLHLGVSYALVPLVCETGHTFLFHVLTGGTGLTAAGATAAGARIWRTTRGGDCASDDRVPRFLALAGMLLSAYFLFLILAEGLPVIAQGTPCDFVPTLDRPIIRSVPENGPTLASIVLVGAIPWGQMATHDRWTGPDEIWSAWTLNPWILATLVALTTVYLAGIRELRRRAGRGKAVRPWRVIAYLGGIAALFVALVSPVHAAAESLFSMHMVQHMLLMVVAAPLLVLGRPVLGYLWGLPAPWRRTLGRSWARSRWIRGAWQTIAHPVPILVLHVGVLWAWHLPGPYQLALLNTAAHHLEHASFFLTALLFWWALSQAGRGGQWHGYGAGILYVFATALQSGALGALLLFAPEPWYSAHAEGTAAWGRDLLTDQQVAGAIMWIPAGLVYAGAGIVLLLAWLRQADRHTARREGPHSAAPGPATRMRG